MQEKTASKINTALDTAMKNLSSLIDVNTVIGKPVSTQDGSIIIPITKVTLGILSGGGEYGKVAVFKCNEDLPFSVGNGLIVSIKPCAFLIKENSSDNYKILSVGSSSYDKLIDKSADLLEKITENKE
jgi:sporulation protein YtfJ